MGVITPGFVWVFFLLTFITKIYKYVSGHRNGSNEDDPQTTRVDEIGLTIRKGNFLFWPFLFVTSFLVSKLMIVNDNSVVSRVEQKSLGANTTLTLTNKKVKPIIGSGWGGRFVFFLFCDIIVEKVLKI